MLEVCTDSIAGVLECIKGGAQRVEICSALSEGGITPSSGFIKRAVALAPADLPVYVLIRPRGGDFLYDEEEVLLMEADVKMAGVLGAAGVVIGCLSPDGSVDEAATKRLMTVAKQSGLDVTFNRAFDLCHGLGTALDQLISLGVPRVLTSGGCPTAMEGAEAIAGLVKRAKGRIAVMAGSGVSASNAAELMQKTGCTELHSSARKIIKSEMVYLRPGPVSMIVGQPGAPLHSRMSTSAKIIRALLAAMTQGAMEKVTFGEKGLPGYEMGAKTLPALIVLQEWWGVNESILEVAELFAAQGVRVLVPDLYKGKIGVDAEEASHLMSNLDFANACAEIAAAAEYLRSSGSPRVACTGFCMGGALAFAAASTGANLDAILPFYGIPQAQYFDISKIKVPVLAQFGTLDKHTGFSDVEAAKAADAKIKAAGGNIETVFYPTGGHGFFNAAAKAGLEMLSKAGNPVMSAEDLAACKEKTFAFLKKHLEC